MLCVPCSDQLVQQRLGATVLKHDHIRNSGYALVAIPHWTYSVSMTREHKSSVMLKACRKAKVSLHHIAIDEWGDDEEEEGGDDVCWDDFPDDDDDEEDDDENEEDDEEDQ